ncbi:hypothetical protein F2Q69_00019267, partial [Brassica cretica]
SQDVDAYLRRSSAAFTELKSFHREIRCTEARFEEEKKRKSDGEIGSEERKRKSKEIDVS